ncbi:MAG: hypothetical protein ACK4N5_18475 [Myxococcales bacterium]
MGASTQRRGSPHREPRERLPHHLLEQLPLLITAAALLLLPACTSGIGSDAECPPEGTALSWQNFGEPYFRQYCHACHSGAVEGPARQGAPAHANFDTLADVRRQLTEIELRRHDMPPPGSPRPTEEESRRLAEWLACGAP